MILELIRVVKKVIWVIVLIALFKIYEHNGFVNPITISVILILFGLLILARLELEE